MLIIWRSHTSSCHLQQDHAIYITHNAPRSAIALPHATGHAAASLSSSRQRLQASPQGPSQQVTHPFQCIGASFPNWILHQILLRES